MPLHTPSQISPTPPPAPTWPRAANPQPAERGSIVEPAQRRGAPQGNPPPQGSTLVGRPTPWQQGSTQRLGSGCGRTPQSTAPHRAAGGGPPWAAAASGPRERPRPSASRGCHGNRARGWSRPPTALGAISGTAAGRGREGRGGAGSRRTTPSHRGPSPPPPLRSQQRPLAASERCAERPLPRPTAPRDPPAAHSPTRQRTAPLTPRSPTRAADASTGSTAPRPHLPSGLPGKSGGRRGFPQTAPSPWAPVPPPSSSSSRLGPHARPTLTFPGPTVTLQAVRRASGAGGAAQTAPTRCGAAARPGAAPAAPAGPSTPGPARVGGCRAGPRQLLAAPGCAVLCEGTRSPPRWDSAEAPGGLQPHGSPASPHTLTSARPAPGPQPPAHQLPVQRPLLRSLSGPIRPGAAG